MIKIKIATNRLKVGDLRKAQRDDIDATLRLIASCMTDAQDEYLPLETALAQLDELDLDTLQADVVGPFMEALEAQRDNVINPTRGSRRS